jgi:hypothetical protein
VIDKFNESMALDQEMDTYVGADVNEAKGSQI